MKNTIKRALSAIIALVILGSITLTAGATAADLAKTQGSSSRIITDIDGLQDGEVYRIKHKNSGKYLTLDVNTGNVIVSFVSYNDDTKQQWVYSGHSATTNSGKRYIYAKFQSNYYFGGKYLNVDGSYNSNSTYNTYLHDGTNIKIFDNVNSDYDSSKWILDGNKLIANRSRYESGVENTNSTSWKYLAPDPNGSGNVAQYGLSSIASGEAEWMFERAVQDVEYSDPLPYNLYEKSQIYGQISVTGVTHTGIDIVDPSSDTAINGIDVHAVADGWVDYYCAKHINDSNLIVGGGVYAVLRLHNGERVLYLHLSACSNNVNMPSGISQNYPYPVSQIVHHYIGTAEYVSKGDVIGKVGSTGNSSGPHLHIELRNSGNTIVNPDRLVAGMLFV